MSPIRENARDEAYSIYPTILEDTNKQERNGFIDGYHSALDDVSDELRRILSISEEGCLESNIKLFIAELEDLSDE